MISLDRFRAAPRRCAFAVIAAASAAALLGAGCTAGPDYHRPALAVPAQFREAGAQWRRAAPDPLKAVSSRWWDDYHDPVLSRLVDDALRANPTIAAAQASWRLARATVAADRASLWPTLGLDASGSRGQSTPSSRFSGAAGPLLSEQLGGVRNTVSLSGSASWEPDLWGAARRQLESGKASEAGAAATLAGQQLSIAASVATSYLQLRQCDLDVDLLQGQREIDARLLVIAGAAFDHGTASNDDVLDARASLDGARAALQGARRAREQAEHALAVWTGVPPASFSIAPDPDYAFREPAEPAALPSTLLERRPDVVGAERAVAAANARIGVAEAAFFPSLDLGAQGGFQHDSLANLLSMPNRVWAVGPALAASLFDGGARRAAVREAEATYDQQVANYRQTVLSAFQGVEDSLSNVNHLREQTRALDAVYRIDLKLFDSARAKASAGTASTQAVLAQQLAVLGARQNLVDMRSALAQGDVALVRNLGGGWDGAAAAHASERR
ncbi:efflux transporter outer membrane subunit [Burkholderia plantarii]|uniref:efflux transporter outer membrane subunit n=1 Tax=Burkholderia plantarii TaxID=41899 RepID=UPI00272AA9F6|nr:efflux transporter outer membrane subunit [Burkholderia plantarii]WLE61995.1 efflux transporter outer membrane subunit [Burkholderia plantarii]